MKIAAQLAFNGVCRQAFTRYAEILGGRITVMNTFGGSDEALPPGSEASHPEHLRFAMLELDGGGALLGNDVPAHDYRSMQGFSVALHLSSAGDAERIFSALSEHGEVLTPLSRVPWAERFGMLRDRFGTPWLILAIEGGTDRVPMHLHRIDPEPSPAVRDAVRQFDVVADTVRLTLDLYGRKGFAPPWVGYLAHKEGRFVGSCGFAGPPLNGEAELAYFTFPGNEGKGIATEMAAAVMRETRRTGAAEAFIAHTLPAEGPSTTILKKLGFQCLGVIEHPEDGPVWKWRESRVGLAAP